MAETNCASAAVQGMPPTLDAILALGTNMGNRVENIDDAVRRLEADGSIIVVARSKLYRTAPWGDTDQDWFVNACIGVRTALSPHELLKRCQAVENDMGRVRTRHWGPRIIDVDILAIRDRQIRDPDLAVPHPLIAERAFVVVPLRDVAPALTIGGKTLDDMIEALDASDVTPLQ
ncbi:MULTISPECIES: 2-amino-4-hydroxy-6-hydroxymethyldihydropteridine diphosphokinase [unclassified Hyphomicrobium]|uniref:2-amino-4-hydroxy-6- hydroxymethyldihydropteridine diphosphokinase n=1 Tax=unclassified Hyphomicrobium TaxID=2619925 RepID=UPI000213F1BF|nr:MULTISPECIES: 2-amino-4-hydroxy-6-hydroxymethyldihydropteridine diphosphokinase [unclassified Hyphomicrobium]CCB64862.1 2-amino-4-hydroxy-6-hydroxymethyldihydropteridinepyrophosphokinase (7, 8-dihydro-6-hydroxymethylpterin-pyrophosphokinase, 6-hydroxymethyl-7,8-dihydropterin pyrophosphokinase, PPPK) [Hyphomicrobium sp. MC1]